MGDTFKNNCFSDDQHLIQRFRDLSSLTVRFLALSGAAHFYFSNKAFKTFWIFKRVQALLILQ
ncbi:hypothetical protein BBC0244_021640 [Bartonella apihabitans]|nr:hypothetical protein BBC0244_021640 [Bartonella apihabitans]